MPNAPRWNAEQLQNARIIASVGRSMGMSQRDILIGIMTALQESTLRNLNYGDRDSLGLFQQRPSAGWGTPEQVTDPRYAARKFFTRLGQIGDRNNLELWRAAQKVQVSAFPRAYAKWEDDARGILANLGGTFEPGQEQEAALPDIENWVQQFWGQQPIEGDDFALESAMEKLLQDDGSESAPGVGAPAAPGAQAPTSPGSEAVDMQHLEDHLNPEFEIPGADAIQEWMDSQSTQGGRATGLRSGVINMAKQFIGTPYVWGGSQPGGFDCSGLLQWVFGQMGVRIPRLAYQQANFGEATSISKIQAGDLVFWGNSSRAQGNHVALYLGDGLILEAPRPGLSVRIRSLGKTDYDDKATGIKLDY